jgi:hypothetical protein
MDVGETNTHTRIVPIEFRMLEAGSWKLEDGAMDTEGYGSRGAETEPYSWEGNNVR